MIHDELMCYINLLFPKLMKFWFGFRVIRRRSVCKSSCPKLLPERSSLLNKTCYNGPKEVKLHITYTFCEARLRGSIYLRFVYDLFIYIKRFVSRTTQAVFKSYQWFIVWFDLFSLTKWRYTLHNHGPIHSN